MRLLVKATSNDYYYYDFLFAFFYVAQVQIDKLNRINTFGKGNHSVAPLNDNMHSIFYVSSLYSTISVIVLYINLVE